MHFEGEEGRTVAVMDGVEKAVGINRKLLASATTMEKKMSKCGSAARQDLRGRNMLDYDALWRCW